MWLFETVLLASVVGLVLGYGLIRFDRYQESKPVQPMSDE